MATPSLGDIIAFFAKKKVIDASLLALLKQNELKYSDPYQAIIETLRDVGRVQMDPTGRAIKFLENFLSNSGTAMTVDVEALLKEDEGVRERVISETYRRVLEINTVKEKAEQAFMTPKYSRNIDPVISIFQHTFKVKDWQLALGSYAFEIELLSTISPRTESFWVALKGNNTYRWAPEEQRTTQEIHRFGQFLVDEGKAKEFQMPAPIHYMLIRTKQAEMIKLTTTRQANPKHAKSDFTLDAVGRAATVTAKNSLSIAAQTASDAVRLLSGARP